MLSFLVGFLMEHSPKIYSQLYNSVSIITPSALLKKPDHNTKREPVHKPVSNIEFVAEVGILK